MLHFLDIFFTVIHILLIIFNLSGWVWKKTRRWHLLVLALTAASWGILGIWHGWGYCPLTDWHWDVKEKLGETNLPNSFVKYVFDNIFNTDMNVRVVDRITLFSLLGAVAASIWVNFILPVIQRRNKPR